MCKSWLRFLMVCLSSSRKILGQHLRLYDYLLSHPFQFINHSTILSSITYIVQKASLKYGTDCDRLHEYDALWIFVRTVKMWKNLTTGSSRQQEITSHKTSWTVLDFHHFCVSDTILQLIILTANRNTTSHSDSYVTGHQCC